MKTELQMIEVRSKNNLPNSRRTKPSSFYAAFEPQKNDLDLNHAHLIVVAHVCSMADIYGRILE